MEICLLNCGEVSAELKNTYGGFDDMFKNFFKKHAPEIVLTVFNVFKDEYPSDIDVYDGFLSGGSLSSVYDTDDWISRYREFVQHLFKQNKKHMGICFGHQMLAHALGGRVEKSGNGWGLGVNKIEIFRQKPWMTGKTLKKINLIFSHQDQVIKLPPDSEIIAGNSHCEIAVLTIADTCLGIQAHPEFLADYQRASLQTKEDRVDPEIIDKALKTLDRKTDNALIAGWITNFYKNGLKEF